jgi:electron transfer flavoprotein beta subunit
MKDIIVCIKQVPDLDSVKLDPVNHTLRRENVDGIMNPYDEPAFEAALECKRRYGSEIGVISMGPRQAEKMLEQCLKRGADEAFCLTDKRLAGSDTLATARALHCAIRHVGYRTIFCGQESTDSGTGHIGASLAEIGGVPQLSYARKVLTLGKNIAKVEVEADNTIQVIRLSLPAVVSFSKKVVKATRKKVLSGRGAICRLSLKDFEMDERSVGLEGSPTTVVDIDIDISGLSYLHVDSELSPNERIDVILGGGLSEKKNRRIYRGLSDESIEAILSILK